MSEPVLGGRPLQDTLFFTNCLDKPGFLRIEIEGMVLEIPPARRVEIRYERPTGASPLELDLEEGGITLYAWAHEVVLLGPNAERTRIWPIYRLGILNAIPADLAARAPSWPDKNLATFRLTDALAVAKALRERGMVCVGGQGWTAPPDPTAPSLLPNKVWRCSRLLNEADDEYHARSWAAAETNIEEWNNDGTDPLVQFLVEPRPADVPLKAPSG